MLINKKLLKIGTSRVRMSLNTFKAVNGLFCHGYTYE